MNFNDALWIERWQSMPFTKLVEGPIKGGCGCEDEPLSSLWCAALAQAMGEAYRERMKLLDYGCGYGRFFNFLSGRLENFTYYGLEVADSETGHGQSCIQFAADSFGSDPRGRFALIGSELEREALTTVDTVLLGSIFTHLSFAAFEKLFGKCMPVIERKGTIVFSIVLADRYSCDGPGKYGMKSCYRETRYTRQQLSEYFDRMGLALTEAEHFQAPSNDLQTIFRVGSSRQSGSVVL
jgi:cyclopropane fatty-acyl-phospholipid synthase-like methyltransferase